MLASSVLQHVAACMWRLPNLVASLCRPALTVLPSAQLSTQVNLVSIVNCNFEADVLV
jgi:hypothetical protein